MKTLFVESLTLRVWFFSIFPRLIRDRLAGRAGWGRNCYLFNWSGPALAAARLTGGWVGLRVEPLRYRLADVRDEEGLLLRLRIAYQDLAEVQADAMREAIFTQVLQEQRALDRLPAYLAKAIASMDLSDRGTLWRALMAIQVCAWRLRQGTESSSEAVFYLERRAWLNSLIRYAARERVQVIPVRPPFRVKAWLSSILSPEIKALLRWILSGRFRKAAGAGGVSQMGGSTPGGGAQSRATRGARGPRIAVEYYGHLNLNRPECYSDLFFWQQSSLPAEQISVLFNDFSRDPLDDSKRKELALAGLRAESLSPWDRFRRNPMLMLRRSPGGGSPETDWLVKQIARYKALRSYWERFFSAEQVKIHISWFKYGAAHCAIADALQRAGGITVIYQRAHEELPSAETAIAADIVFGFSRKAAEVERLSNSRIAYHITAGYLGDHRFPLLKEQARRVRESLRRHGAQRIIAFTDENSMEDARWQTGHEFQQHNYAFLLEKLLANPWLGLVIKPKVPSSLRRRLGPVAALLSKAEATGRCILYEEGVLQGSYPPAAAALASDLMIHGHLCAGTAGMEAALAGVPTLLLDREGWSRSPLYRLGLGRVVFTDWRIIWKGCLEHWERPGGVPGFGDWSPLLEELDPFRDGQAAERMGTTLQWILEGFTAGLPREVVMADAAERYAQRWGRDKVTQVNVEPTLPVRPERVEGRTEAVVVRASTKPALSSPKGSARTRVF